MLPVVQMHDPQHLIVADAHAVPKPFRTFAVRSEEGRHAAEARAPYGRVHLIRTTFIDGAGLDSLAALGWASLRVSAFSDIDSAPAPLEALASATSSAGDIVAGIAAALRTTGLLGAGAAAYRSSVAARIDFLASCGAGFHNDVRDHWSACLFWNLALAATDVEFVMPHAGVRQRLLAGDLIVFDQTMAHGLCRPRDQGQAVADSFESGQDDCRQMFLSGELPLSDAQWAALGSPWLPVETHHDRGALDLTAAEFDERSGAIKSLRSLANCMLRTTCYVDAAQPCAVVAV